MERAIGLGRTLPGNRSIASVPLAVTRAAFTDLRQSRPDLTEA